jgi:hypothetical protein
MSAADMSASAVSAGNVSTGAVMSAAGVMPAVAAVGLATVTAVPMGQVHVTAAGDGRDQQQCGKQRHSHGRFPSKDSWVRRPPRIGPRAGVWCSVNPVLRKLGKM